jgi:hypothetical protein
LAERQGEGEEGMKTYIFSFVGYNKAGERIVEDIRERVSIWEDLMGIKERHAMALEEEFKKPFVCVEIREVTE